MADVVIKESAKVWTGCSLAAPPAVSLLCSGLCLAASVASCVNPLGAGTCKVMYSSCKVSEVSASITGIASCICGTSAAIVRGSGQGWCEAYKDKRNNDPEVVTDQPL